MEQTITVETGVVIENMEKFFFNSEVRDLLDSITVINQYVSEHFGDSFSKNWLSRVNRIFTEEHLAYRAEEEEGIVRPFVDEEFQVNRATALNALANPKFGEARSDFEAAHRHLRDGNTKEALRMMFPAVEVAARVLFPGVFARLMPNEVDKHLKPAVERRYAGNKPAVDAGRLLLDGMKAWIAAAQLYRHGQQQQEPTDPPMDFVIAHLSAGATYLRWMIEVCSE
jgi:hypothetical protein